MFMILHHQHYGVHGRENLLTDYQQVFLIMKTLLIAVTHENTNLVTICDWYQSKSQGLLQN